MSVEIPPDEVLPCGCLLRCSVVEDGVKTLTIIPCRPSCKNFNNALDLARDASLPIERIVGLP